MHMERYHTFFCWNRFLLLLILLDSAHGAQIAAQVVKLLGKIAFLRSHKSELTGLTKDPGTGPMTSKTFINNFWLKEMIFSIFNSARHGETHYGN